MFYLYLVSKRAERVPVSVCPTVLDAAGSGVTPPVLFLGMHGK